MATRQLTVKIVGDNQLGPGLRGSTTALERFSRKARDVGRSMTRNLTLPLVGFGYIAARELMSGQEAMAQTQAVIESTGGAAQKTVDDIVELSRSLSEMSSIDDEDIQGLANTLLTFRNISGPVFDEATAAALDLSVAMGTDLHAAGIQLGKALNDPITGLTALTRVGVTFDERQREWIEHLVEMGDVAGAQRVILAELTAEFGGSAEALGGTVTGRFNRLKNKMEELGASILENLMPAIEDLAGMLNGLANSYDGLTSTQQKWVAGMVAALAVAGPLASALGGLATVLGWLATAVGAVVGAIGGMGLAVVAAAAVVVGGAIYIATHWRETTEFLRNSWMNISNLARTIWSNISASIRNAANNAASAVGVAVDRMLAFIRSIPGRVGAVAAGFGSILVNAGRAIIQGLWDGMQAVWDDVTSWLGGLADIIPDWKGPLSKDRKILIPTGRVIMEGLGEGLESGLTTEVRPVLAGATTSFASDFMPASRPTISGGGMSVVVNVTVNGDADAQAVRAIEAGVRRGLSTPQLDRKIRRLAGAR